VTKQKQKLKMIQPNEWSNKHPNMEKPPLKARCQGGTTQSLQYSIRHLILLNMEHGNPIIIKALSQSSYLIFLYYGFQLFSDSLNT